MPLDLLGRKADCTTLATSSFYRMTRVRDTAAHILAPAEMPHLDAACGAARILIVAQRWADQPPEVLVRCVVFSAVTVALLTSGLLAQESPQAPRGFAASVGEWQGAVEQQLGLRLESTKGPVDVLVIDSVERPTEN